MIRVDLNEPGSECMIGLLSSLAKWQYFDLMIGARSARDSDNEVKIVFLSHDKTRRSSQMLVKDSCQFWRVIGYHLVLSPSN